MLLDFISNHEKSICVITKNVIPIPKIIVQEIEAIN